jgi:hypothetical protein
MSDVSTSSAGENLYKWVQGCDKILPSPLRSEKMTLLPFRGVCVCVCTNSMSVKVNYLRA